ncbi:hypothetical protein AURDEDRAFT_112415 [Auricularia subglabra TFB-10046 SS5]|nr:hypothetical protein AURDEDRAFT_112415 [Auricularia subglabra TFB-10046 SS5]
MSTSTRPSPARTVTDTQPAAQNAEPVAGPSTEPAPPQGVLRLRGGPRSGPRVTWTEDIVDNEHLGKKKSKICCIYHKPRKFDESSDESSDDDSDCDGHDHDHDGHVHSHKGDSRRNAYEAQPKNDKPSASSS